MDFRPIDIESKIVFDSFFKNKYENSETSFANLYMWKDYYNTVYTVYDGFLVIVNTSPNGKLHCYMPYGKGNIEKCLGDLYEYVKSQGQALRITNASEEQTTIIKEVFPKVIIRENDAFNDYVYSSEKLITLSGKKLHSKRNHLNKFKATYDYSYRPMTKEDFASCLELAGKLMLKDRDADSLSYVEELRSINTAFENFDIFEMSGGVIEIEGQIRAFTVGEPLTDECALIHIEKADTNFDGIYAAINNEFVKNRWSDYKYINREEDMGIPGLRKAKLSYRPDHMVRKFMCIVDE